MEVKIPGGWDTPEVAAAQRELVLKELQHLDAIAPFRAFLQALAGINLHRGSLLDVGCGCGHYGAVCARRYPGLEYHGTDASLAMIAEARQIAPTRRFSVCRFEDNAFDAFDIVLVSQVLEYTTDPWQALDMVLGKFKRYLILHRIRLTAGESHRFDESTYCGYSAPNYLWNLDTLLEHMEGRAAGAINGDAWENMPNMATLWVSR